MVVEIFFLEGLYGHGRGSPLPVGGTLRSLARLLPLLLTALAVPVGANAQSTPEPLPRGSVGIGVAFNVTDAPSSGAFANYLTAGPRGTWAPAPWVGLSGEVYGATLLRAFPWGWGIGARVGLMLRWPLGWGPVSPYLLGQCGGLGVLALGGGAGAGGEVRGEVGVDIPLWKAPRPGTLSPARTFLSLGGGVGTVRLASSTFRLGFGRIAFGVGL